MLHDLDKVEAEYLDAVKAYTGICARLGRLRNNKKNGPLRAELLGHLVTAKANLLDAKRLRNSLRGERVSQHILDILRRELPPEVWQDVLRRARAAAKAEKETE